MHAYEMCRTGLHVNLHICTSSLQYINALFLTFCPRVTYYFLHIFVRYIFRMFVIIYLLYPVGNINLWFEFRLFSTQF